MKHIYHFFFVMIIIITITIIDENSNDFNGIFSIRRYIIRLDEIIMVLTMYIYF